MARWTASASSCNCVKKEDAGAGPFVSPFPREVTTAGESREVLIEMLKQARAQA